MIWRRQATATRPPRVVVVEPLPEEPEPQQDAAAWCRFYARQAESAWPEWLPSPSSRMDARTRALRAGQYVETSLTG